MAIEQGGNCPLTERDKIVIKHGVKLIGIANLPALVAADASALYARNLLSFLDLLLDPKTGTAQSESRGRDHRGRAGVHRRRGGEKAVTLGRDS